MKSDPIYSPALRLAGSHQQFIEELPKLGETYIQTRNRGGGLGKYVSGISPIQIDKLDYAFDPDAGVGFSLTDLIAIHSSSMEMDTKQVPVIDLEFCSFPAGLSFFEIPGMSVAGATGKLVSRFGGTSMKPGELEAWRKEIQPEPDLCQSCVRESRIRVEEMERHPLFDIVDHAAVNSLPLDCRLTGDHADLTASIVPYEMHHATGVLIVSAENCLGALHIDFRYVHTMTIHTSMIDGKDYSILEIYDMHGVKNFQIMSDSPGISRLWQSLCEEANSSRL